MKSRVLYLSIVAIISICLLSACKPPERTASKKSTSKSATPVSDTSTATKEATEQAPASSRAALSQETEEAPQTAAVTETNSGNSTETVNAGEKITAEEVRQRTETAIAALSSFAKQKEAEYLKQIDQRLAQFEAELDQVRSKAREMSVAAKKEVQSEMTAINKKMALTQQQLQELNNSNNDRLGGLADKLDKMVASIEQSMPADAASSESQTN